ncbi:MAG: SPFH domain-containing protein [Myxococcales bacterium]|nr:SPFH domain-containing protein [Myxococcales bacterium]MDD9964654.1 SPFH domain-containing protein [Myxococcales bacterium]
MADIRNFAVCRHFRADPTSHVLKYRAGKLARSGRGLAFWFLPMSASIAEVPMDDRELMLMFHTRSSDFQDVTVQGVVTFRVTDAERLAGRVDFTLDLGTGVYAQQPMEKLSLMVTQIAQQHAAAYVTVTPVRQILVEGYDRIRAVVQTGLEQERGLTDAGIEVVAVRVSMLSPTPELEKALEMPMREHIQQQADEAGFKRRAMAVENERAIQENELQNQIELARREQNLIDQRGNNEIQRVQQETEARRVEAEAEAQRTRVAASARAEGLRLVENAKAEGEQARMNVYRDLPQSVMVGLAARELAGKLERIEHLNVTPEMFGPLLSNLLQAGTDRLKVSGDPT